jgi:2-oxoglutarate ferredoxin oxidoreductase subunit beta
MTYTLENNASYGLTAGQFSATADKGGKAKKSATNKDAPVDTVSLALLMRATFVARSFSGEKHQLTPSSRPPSPTERAAFIDAISPCVAFNNHAGSTKSYELRPRAQRGRQPPRLLPNREAITVDYSEGGVIEVPQHDGSIIKFRKLDAAYEPADKVGAMAAIARAAQKGEVLTGLLYLSPDAEDLHAHLNTYEVAFNKLGEKDLCPGAGMLEKINAALR